LNQFKKLVVPFMIMMSILFISACSSDADNEKNEEPKEEETTNVENEENEESSDEPSEPSEPSEDSNSEVEEPAEEETESVLQVLKPNQKVKKTFNQNDGEFTLTETIVDMNDQYIQRVLTIGDMVTLQVLEWNDEKVQLVYEESNPSQPGESILADFTPNKESKPLVDPSKKGKGDSKTWEIISENETVKVPYQTFENVYAVKSTVAEGSRSTIHTIYYAPGIGMIKEVFEETGEGGYTVESVLEEVESL
jgi:PBP1b-binding outer membrane lipoprotein LpoB